MASVTNVTNQKTQRERATTLLSEDSVVDNHKLIVGTTCTHITCKQRLAQKNWNELNFNFPIHCFSTLELVWFEFCLTLKIENCIK